MKKFLVIALFFFFPLLCFSSENYFKIGYAFGYKQYLFFRITHSCFSNYEKYFTQQASKVISVQQILSNTTEVSSGFIEGWHDASCRGKTILSKKELRKYYSLFLYFYKRAKK